MRLIKSSEHHLVGVVTPRGNTAMYRLAQNYNIPALRPSVLKDGGFAKWIEVNEVDVLLNVHLLEIIHPDNIRALNIGGFNLHPGPLPEYAGLNTPSWAIYNDELTYGVTLHWLSPKIDTGPIAYRSVVHVKPDDTGLSLSTRCTMEGMELISELLNDLSKRPELIPKMSQDLENRTYYHRSEVPQEGKIDWNRTADEIDRFVRASNYGPFKSPWGYPITVINSGEVEILAIKPLPMPSDGVESGTIQVDEDGKVRVATSDYWIQILSCRVQGKPVAPEKVFQAEHLAQ